MKNFLYKMWLLNVLFSFYGCADSNSTNQSDRNVEATLESEELGIQHAGITIRLRRKSLSNTIASKGIVFDVEVADV